ncbi:MAG: hypothetical protein K5821_15975 [Nitrobacter sp.]|nr:hypothetical protein [Nitrobacter sp.]
MPAATQSKSLDFAGSLPKESRHAIEALLASEPKASRKIYAALAHKVWSLLVERRFDDEIRDWHDLINGARARIRATDAVSAERLTALADLLRESISLAQTSPAHTVANRPRARSILDMLDQAGRYVARRDLLAELQLGSSHLSNVLTQLSAHALIERRGKGKEAEYRITHLGRQLIGGDGVRDDPVLQSTPAQSSALTAQIQKIDYDRLRTPNEIDTQVSIMPALRHGSVYELGPRQNGVVWLNVAHQGGDDHDQAGLMRPWDRTLTFRHTRKQLAIPSRG